MDAEYSVDIEITSKPVAEYQTDEWMDTELPCAPAIMLDDDVLVEGSDIEEERLIRAIRERLGMPPNPL